MAGGDGGGDGSGGGGDRMEAHCFVANAVSLSLRQSCRNRFAQSLAECLAALLADDRRLGDIAQAELDNLCKPCKTNRHTAGQTGSCRRGEFETVLRQPQAGRLMKLVSAQVVQTSAKTGRWTDGLT